MSSYLSQDLSYYLALVISEYLTTKPFSELVYSYEAQGNSYWIAITY